MSQQIRSLWTKVSGDENAQPVTVEDFLKEQGAAQSVDPKEIVKSVEDLKAEALKLGKTPLGLKYYTEAKLLEANIMPLLNETVSAGIETRMIELQRQAVGLAGDATRKLVMERSKQLKEVRLVNGTLSKVTGGLSGMKKLFKKLNGEQNKLFDTIGATNFATGFKLDRETLEAATGEWEKNLASLNQGTAPA
jgi:hypothetical protein